MTKAVECQTFHRVVIVMPMLGHGGRAYTPSENIGLYTIHQTEGNNLLTSVQIMLEVHRSTRKDRDQTRNN